ncbi:MAG TPA: GNAT family N-acetyltransferase [Blastocatellia bacterium]|nr:GNAT family N-acetyltransferase [Blastocatellia bacterium]
MGPRDIMDLPPDVTIRSTLSPGDIGYVTYLHGTLYAAEYGWDHTFEAYVAGPLAEFGKSHNDRERIWIVEEDGKVAGSIAIVEASRDEAQLRWLLLHPTLRGQGIGRILMDEAISFCKESHYSRVFLWTERALTAAASVYLSFGFQLTAEKTHELWGSTVTEQRYELNFS